MVGISFIVPVYNTSAKKLHDCIYSILNNNEQIAYELIIINDGSTEKMSCEYVNLINQINCSNVKYVYQQNQGVSAARNKGIQMASGQYIMFVDSDDEIISTNLSCDYSSDLILFTHYFKKGQKEEILRSSVDGESRTILFEDFAWIVLTGKLRGACGNLYRREFLLEHGLSFEEGRLQGEDADFHFRFMTCKPVVQFVRKPIYRYFYSVNTSMNRWKKHPVEMLAGEANRYRRDIHYLESVFSDDCEWRKRKLSERRINELFADAVSLCSTQNATEANKAAIKQMMSEVNISRNDLLSTRIKYAVVVNDGWKWIKLYASLRLLYLRMLKI